MLGYNNILKSFYGWPTGREKETFGLLYKRWINRQAWETSNQGKNWWMENWISLIRSIYILTNYTLITHNIQPLISYVPINNISNTKETRELEVLIFCIWP